VKSWAVPAAVVVFVEYAFALTIGAHVGFHYTIPFEDYFILGLAFAGIGVTAAALLKLALYAYRRETAPTQRLLAEIPALLPFVSGVLLAALQIAVLTWTKVMLPIASPFWADGLLANADRAIFGAEPWALAWRLFGWAAPLVDGAYVTWAPLKFATLLFVFCMPESARKSRSLVSYFAMMGTVAVSQYLLSSAGPVFYSQLGLGTRFDHLPIEPWVQTTRAYLWQDYLKSGGSIGGGISAMPSLHVAAALWMALVWRSYQRRAGILAFAYFTMIAVGSVLLGWHYAVDAIAAVLITGTVWALAPRISAQRLGDRRRRLPAGIVTG
jgi:hypothetical protein